MKKINLFTLLIGAILFFAISCRDKNEPPTPPKPIENIPIVSQFVYDGISAYYLWSNEMVNKKPTVKDADPKQYFKSILYKTDIEHSWSWITDDANALVAEFAGEPKTFGYSLGFTKINNIIYAFIQYAFANTPASNAGLNRLDLIGKINGQLITTEIGTDGKERVSKKDIDILYGNNAATFTLYKLTDAGIVQNKEVQVTPATVKTDPVLFDKIYTIGNKKIGYVFYTTFIANFNYRLHEVFNKFKQEGVTDLVLDLRYNPGGGVNAASYLVSLFAPETAVKDKSVLVKMNYNQFLNDYFDKKGITRSSKLGIYQEKDVYEDGKLIAKAEPNPLTANLNLNKVYIIATGNSASASELTTFCSRAIIGESNVIHIGGQTSGKYTASWTLHPYSKDIGIPVYDEAKLSSEDKNTFKNWAMQPIVANYSDKNGKDFINPGYLEPNYSLKEGFGYIDYWKPIGDTKDVFLGQALYLITGDESYKPIQPKSTRSTIAEIEILDKSLAKPIVIDNLDLTPEDFKEIMRMRNLR